MNQTIFEYQNKLHKLLREFLEFYSVTLQSRLLYPCIDTHYNRFSELKELVEKLELKNSALILKKYSKKKISSKEYALILSVLFKEFYSKVKPSKKKRTIKKDNTNKYENWFLKAKSDPYLKPLHEITQRATGLKDYLVAFYLHGSMATLDYEKGFSDVDTLMILKKEVVEDDVNLLNFRKKLRKMQSLLFSIDSSQHHGFSVITEQEMKFYPETYFPLVIFDYSIPVIKPDKDLKFFLRDDSEERRKHFLNIFEYFEKVSNENIKLKNVWQWKMFFSKVLFLPTAYLQVKGKHMYKKDGFKEVKAEVIERATDIRKNWKQESPLIKTLIKLLIIFNNPNLPLILCMSRKFRMINKQEKNYFRREAFLLAEKLKKELK